MCHEYYFSSFARIKLGSFLSLRFFDWNFGIVPTVYVIYYIYSILTIFLSNIAGVTRGAGQLALSSLIPIRCYGAGVAQLEFSVFVHGDYCFSLSLLFSLVFLAMQLL